MTPMNNGIDPSLKHRFAPDDDEAEDGSIVGVFILRNEPQL